MRPSIYFCLIMISISACTNTKSREKELQLQQKELELKERELALKEKEKDPVSTSVNYQNNEATPTTNNAQLSSNIPVEETKYIFVVIRTNEPEIKEIELPQASSSFNTGYSRAPLTEYEKYTVPKFYTYKSDVIEIPNYNEDKKYREMDKFEKSVRRSLEQVNFNLRLENERGRGKPAIGAEASIISKKAYVYDSYRAASEQRN